MRTYGWKPDLPDQRDRLHLPAELDAAKLPRHVELAMGACWDQGTLGACTAFAIGGAFAYERSLLGQRFVPSFLQLYYCERAMEGTINQDAGAFIRDGAKVAAQQGLADASKWPYHESRFAARPPKSVLLDALNNRVTSYARVPQALTYLKATLAEKNTIVFGFSVYESFEDEATAASGVVEMPKPHEAMLGGHAVLLVGYDEDEQMFKVRNSWGTSWGANGYFWMPYEYVTDPNLADDFWTLKTVTEAET